MNKTEGAMDNSSFESNNTLATKNAKQIENLNGMLRRVLKTDYCCCPQTNYSISFYNNNENIGTYFADTIEFKNKIRIFEGGYQYSFIIEKKFWENYLKELKSTN